MLLEAFSYGKWLALPPPRQAFGTMLRCLIVMQWLCVNAAAGAQARLRGASVGSRGMARKIDETVSALAISRLEEIHSTDGQFSFSDNAVPAVACLSWALVSLQHMVKAKHLIDSFTVEGEFDRAIEQIEDSLGGFGRNNFAMLDDQTKRQKQMKRPLTAEETKLVADALACGVTEDHLRSDDLLSFDDGGEWPAPNPKRKVSKNDEFWI